ncbi:5-(carboxyamino)imidazole ribonucleotide synthase [Pseudoglutamicibacter cumminsii]|uniref:5-(carboxyamino)imidazole ribonucleotide synthase n=1 Tax=Pseudoglutamicibacter cumminsii TaxID=156979 RepID=UPI0026EC0185|nr:5-(carboxyamino)imidazole ribonucleotide synthase [Pseudoglutamicibacter cumminsii]
MKTLRIGVIGGGQLARMMAPAALNLGIELSILCESEETASARAVAHAPVGDYKDRQTVLDFAESVDVVTFDHEHVPAEILHELVDKGVRVHPGPDALIHAQDKIVMREAVERLGLPNPLWCAADTANDVVTFGEKAGWPIIAKTPRGGYDGKGVEKLDSADDVERISEWFERGQVLCEELVDFSRELSALVARRPSGETAAWPVAHTIQVAGVCDEVIAPAQDLSTETAQAAQQTALTIASELGVTGVLAVELFETPGRGPGFLINELAMRPHNTGHWTQNGAVTSQFEQHLRAVADLPLGSAEPLAPVAVMKNFLGGSNEDLAAALPHALTSDPQVKVHVYGKSVRPGRKIGHVNRVGFEGESVDDVREKARVAANIMSEGFSA